MTCAQFVVDFICRQSYSDWGVPIMPEYLMVSFPYQREVLINGESRGATNELLSLEGGAYEVRLGPPPDFTPTLQQIDLRNTSALTPLSIEFQEI
jgi:hypothetical protein